MIGGIEITLKVDSYKMMEEIKEILCDRSVCNLCEFQNEEDSLLIEKKMCDVCTNKELWRIRNDILAKITEIIERNVDVGY